MPPLFNQVTGMLFLLSFILKAIFQYLHVKSYSGMTKRITYYTFAFPIIDVHKSFYKHCANFCVVYQYVIIFIFFFQYKENLAEMWEMWKISP